MKKVFPFLCSLIFFGFQPVAAQATNVAERLGYSKDDKLLIIHADDLGVAHSENKASIKAMAGASASVLHNTAAVSRRGIGIACWRHTVTTPAACRGDLSMPNFLDDVRKASVSRYMAQKDHEVLAKLREAMDREASAAAIAESGVNDQDLVQSLVELGIELDTLPVLHLVPLFQVAWSDGEVQTRQWKIKKIDNHNYEGTAGDVVGTAKGYSYGPAFKFEYVLLVPVKGRDIKISFDDWIFMQDEKVAINRAKMTKFGIKVAELTVMFIKD